MTVFSETLYKTRWLLSRPQKWQWCILGILSLIASLFELVTAASIALFAYVLGAPADKASTLSTVKSVFGSLSPQETILWAAFLCGSTYALKNIFLGFESFYQNRTIHNMLNQFRTRLLTLYPKRAYIDFISKNTTHRFEIIENDSEQFFLLGMKSLAAGFSEVMMAIVLFSAIFYIHPTLALCIMALTTTLTLIMYLTIMRRFYHLGQSWQAFSLNARQRLLEFFHAFKDITLLGKSSFFIEQYRFFSQKRAKAKAQEATFGELPKLILEAAFVGVSVFAVWFLIHQQTPLHEIYAILGLYVYAGFRLIPITVRLTGYGNHLAMAKPFIERLYTEVCGQPLPSEHKRCTLTFNKNLSFKNVSYCYPGTSRNALHNVSFSIPKGSCVGIVGKTGSGKSTLLDLLLGLLIPTSGHITLDDHFCVNNAQWHAMIGYVPQAPYLIDDTIARNIALGEQAPHLERLQKVVEQTQLTPLVKTLEKGLDTHVGEKGVRLSGGERQRIAIARALYHNPSVLIFDEATSALDSHTEQKVIETLHNVSKGRTLVMVAHRTTTLAGCDTIFVMEHGHLSKTTTYKALSS